MKLNTIAALKAGAAPMVLGLAMISSSAFAQAAAEADDANAETIVVTGSLIRNPNLVSAVPINVTTAEEISLKQSNVAEEVLREIPGVVASLGSAVNNGATGANYVDMRGLDYNRNIVLLDGNRIVPGGLRGAADLNNIPLALISRVENQTGAAVTTYGADAITGVVNFITKTNFSGVDLAVSERLNGKGGDGKFFRADLTVGGNFADDRGNAVLSIGYQKSDPVYQGDRDFSIYNVDSYSGTAGGSGTTIPSRFSVPGLGNRVIDPASGNLNAGFSPFNFNPYNIFQTPFKRYNVFAQANYKISDTIEVYTRGLFSRNSVSTIIAPSGVFASSVVIPYSNPYLPVSARNTFCTANGVSAAACGAAALATSPSDPNYKTFTTVLRRRFTETGTRNSEFVTNVFDYRLGLRGEITDSINWDVSGSYGESENIQTQTGYVLTSKVRDALLATNKTTCLSNASGCVPLNVFGAEGSITPEMAKGLLSPSTATIRTALSQVRGLVSGETGFAIPGSDSPVSFALGAEYRNYKASQSSDTLSKTAGELGGAGGAQPEIDGAYSVYEGYGEFIAPIVEDKPGIKSLTFGAGARYSGYKVRGGPKNNAFTYKFDLAWEPSDGIKFRANYAHATRAPNILELFRPATVSLTNLSVDPCSGAAPVTNATLRAVCLAQGAPANTIGLIANPTAAQANASVSGNINLKPEKANTWTVGAVLQPSFAPRMSLSIDYYNIKVKEAIATALPGDVIAACFGGLSAASVTNPACTSIRRDPTTGTLDGDPATTFGLPLPYTNSGKLFTDGIDLLINYNQDFGSIKWKAAFVGNYTMHQKFQAGPTALDRDCVGYYSVNCGFTQSLQPKFQWSLRNTFTLAGFDASVLWRHISAMSQEPDDIIQSGAAFSGTLPAGIGALSGKTVDFGHISAANYFDVTLRYTFNDNFTLTGGVQNVFNKQPTVVGSTIGGTGFNSGNVYPSTYDALGRRFSIEGRVKF
jgi:iron complex outermembrane recepter protein